MYQYINMNVIDVHILDMNIDHVDGPMVMKCEPSIGRKT